MMKCESRWCCQENDNCGCSFFVTFQNNLDGKYITKYFVLICCMHVLDPV